ncbi:MAG: SDR family NAD(P)-dependent oxidoreductase [Spirochaetales bacterium]|nr:SDR family NAD(P)-dependent oxidoreductase [Spirochaetales bacterium]
MDIQQKTALVTGASRGVGMRVARALADRGCHLILHSRNTAGTDALAAQLKKQGARVHQVAAELADPDALESLIAEVKDVCGGKLDILYNNAAVMTPYLSRFTVPASDYAVSFQVNAIAPAKLCDAFIPGMLERGWGRVVNVTSGIADQPELMAYSCSKAALDRYVRDMVPTLKGTNVLMNLLDPGWLRTDLGGPDAPNDPDSVLPGALVPVLLDQEAGSGKLYRAQDYAQKP